MEIEEWSTRESDPGSEEARKRIAAWARVQDPSQRLNLSGLNLRTLPSELFELTALTRLDLRSNGLRALPAEIGRLTALTTLDLSGNGLTTLPAEIGGLTALTTLYLHGNP